MLRLRCTAFLAVMATAAACATVEETSPLPTYTGIRIDATAQFAKVGCGTRSDQAFKYFALVNETGQSGVFDCYADSVFQVDPGKTYTIVLRTFNKTLWTAAEATGATPDKADALFSDSCSVTAWDRALTTARCTTPGTIFDAGADASPIVDASSD